MIIQKYQLNIGATNNFFPFKDMKNVYERILKIGLAITFVAITNDILMVVATTQGIEWVVLYLQA